MEETELNTSTNKNIRLTETFYKMFPFYLSIGMNYDQYWNDDVCLTKYYREADKLNQERINQEKWLQGLYFYDAISTSLFNMWGRSKGKQPKNYAEKPYDFNHSISEEEKKKVESEKAKVWLMNFVNSFK
ncbi:MAG: hypothetical protein ACLRVU_01280 [Beduini sp.]|uniref:hypothetical protein n=1 Tax=Beduini sp. TaxID=1922300 RepID=UPI0039A35F44